MARQALISKTKRLKEKLTKAHESGKKKNGLKVRAYNRCALCGRPRGYLRDFAMCRICFREYASRGEIVGVKKSSW